MLNSETSESLNSSKQPFVAVLKPSLIHQVPRSSKLVAEDGEYSLYSVVLFRRVADSFKANARTRGFQVTTVPVSCDVAVGNLACTSTLGMSSHVDATLCCATMRTGRPPAVLECLVLIELPTALHVVTACDRGPSAGRTSCTLSQSRPCP